LLTSRLRTSVIHRLSLSIWGLFLGLVVLLSVLGYVALSAVADRVVPLVMRQAVELRAQAVEGLFIQAGQSAQHLQQDLLTRLRAADTEAALSRFDELFARGPDGLWRLRPAKVDTVNAPTLYLHHGRDGPDESTRVRAAVSYDLLRERGPALVPPFFSAYMDFVEDGLMVYARGVDWASGATADASNADYPTMRGADPQRNSERRIFWTPVYFDEQAKAWMVSVIQPLDWRGRWVGTVGHDLSIETLIDAVAASRDQVGVQLILSAEGDLISHPDLRERIAAASGQLQIASLKDPLLEQVHHMVSNAQADRGAGLSADGTQWIAWSRIRGPHWYQIYLMPQSRVDGLVMWGMLGLCGIGLLGLMPVLWSMRRRVNTLVVRPLQRLTEAVDTLGQGQTPTPVALGTDDELGRLARAFDGMVSELAQKRAMAAAHAQALQTEVDERRQYMVSLEEERARLFALLGAMKLGILFVTAENQVTYCNPAFLKIWRIEGDEASFVGRPACDIFQAVGHGPPSLAALARHAQEALTAPGLSSRYEMDLGDGQTLLLTSHPVHDSDKRLIGRLCIHEDVTRERKTAAQLIYLAERDALTGLYNRRRFEDELLRFFREFDLHGQPDRLDRRDQHDRQGALLFFDLDEFKAINDTFGHRIGDSVLVRVGSDVQALVRQTETLCRLGGDEFAVLMPHASVEDAQRLAERIVRAISQGPLCIDGQNLRLTTSLGIALAPQHADNAQDLVAHADAAMYQAKHLGKNCWSVYRPDHHASQETITRLAWNERISRALERNLLRLHYQGVYDATTGELSHLEVLVRMRDEADATRLIGPMQFIGYAEKSGKILEIDRWVARESIALLGAQPLLPALAINISARSFDDPSLPAYIAAQLQAAGVAPQRLLVELTETSAVSDLRDAERFIDTLRHTGCQVCLDDFGTGFASFAYLKHLKVDVLKIDGLFIRNLTREHDNQVFVRAIIDVARGLGRRTVAEFVESQEILDMLKTLGVDMVQGYHLDQPQAAHPALATPTV